MRYQNSPRSLIGQLFILGEHSHGQSCPDWLKIVKSLIGPLGLEDWKLAWEMGAFGTGGTLVEPLNVASAGVCPTCQQQWETVYHC